MRMLFIRPSGGAVSGAEIYNLTLIENLKKRYDGDITFITDNERFKKRLESLGIDAFSLGPRIKEIGTKKEFLSGLLSMPFMVTRYLYLIKRLERANSISTVVLESMNEKIFLTPFLSRKKKKIMWIEHGPLFKTDRFILIKSLYRRVSRYADVIIAVSKDTYDDLSQNNIKSKMTILSPGVDAKKFAPMNQIAKEKRRQALSISQKIVIGYSGSITKEKGIGEFLTVAKCILEKRKDVLFLLIGDGNFLIEAKYLAKTYGIEKNILFTGQQTDVSKYMSVMDIFLFPTNHIEGTSVALLEAAASGLLIITHNIGGNKEIVKQNETGILYDTFDAEKICDQIDDVILHTKKYEKMRKAARKLVETDYSAELFAEKFYQLCIRK